MGWTANYIQKVAIVW